MDDVERIPIEHFVEQVPLKVSALLESHGFHRDSSEESVTPTGATFFYRGKNVGFYIYLDYRDQIVGTTVAKIRNGKVVGGRSRAEKLLLYLIAHERYQPDLKRFSPVLMHHDYRIRLEGELDVVLELLTKAGLRLLADKPDSLS